MSDEDPSDAASEESASDDSESEPDDSAFGFEARSDPDEAVDDPFAELGPGVGDRAADDPADPGHPATPTDPDASAAADEAATDEAAAAPADDPFADLEPGTDADDDLFEEMDVGAVDDEDVWTALDEDAGDDGDADRGGHDAASAGDEEHLVEMRSYCQQCPHFSSPPDTACTHEGTTIVEAVDFDTFRVRNCPIVGADGPAFDDE